jgi:hypothetical protein
MILDLKLIQFFILIEFFIFSGKIFRNFEKKILVINKIFFFFKLLKILNKIFFFFSIIFNKKNIF